MRTLLYPLATEKSIRLMESENVLTFIVDKKASKPQIKEEFERMMKAKVKAVRTTIFMSKKKAFITIKSDTAAIDIATNLGLM